jgi:hypothetical protein
MVQEDKATIIIIIIEGYTWEENGERNFYFKGLGRILVYR